MLCFVHLLFSLHLLYHIYHQFQVLFYNLDSQMIYFLQILDYQKKYKGIGNWYCYDDIENITAVTTEDFIDNKLINKAIKSVLETNLISLNIELQNSDSKDKVALIKSKLHSNNIEKTTVDKIVNEVKEYVCEHTKATNLDETYHKVFEVIIKDLFK